MDLESWRAVDRRTDPVDPTEVEDAMATLYGEAGLDRPRVIVAPSPMAAGLAYQEAVLRKRYGFLDKAPILVAGLGMLATVAGAAGMIVAQPPTSIADGAVFLFSIALMLAFTAAGTLVAGALADRACRPRSISQLNTRLRARPRLSLMRAELPDGRTELRRKCFPVLPSPLVTDKRDVSLTPSVLEAANETLGRALGRAARVHLWRAAISLTRQRVLVDGLQGGQEDLEAIFASELRGELPRTPADHAWRRALLACGVRFIDHDLVIVSDRPTTIRVNAAGQLHDENGPAVEWRDGWRLYFLEGIEIDPALFERADRVSPADALAITDPELRRVVCQRVGWLAILDHFGARVIDTDDEPQIGQLVEASRAGEKLDLNDFEADPHRKPSSLQHLNEGDPMLRQGGWPFRERRFLVVRCGTDRSFAIPVPETMQTALEAQAWTWGMEPDQFVRPEVRT